MWYFIPYPVSGESSVSVTKTTLDPLHTGQVSSIGAAVPHGKPEGTLPVAPHHSQALL